MKRQVILTFITALLTLTLVQCRDKRDEPIPPTPTPAPTPSPTSGMEKVHITAEIVVVGDDGKTTTVTTADKEATRIEEVGIGAIEGIGPCTKGQSTTVIVSEENEKYYTLKSLYEKNGKGGLTKEKTPEKKEGRATLTITVQEDMNLVVIFRKEKQPELEFRQLYNHDYWVRKNKEAYDHIKPKIVYIDRLEQIPEFSDIWAVGANSVLDNYLFDKVIYREEPSTFHWSISRKNPDRGGDGVLWYPNRFEEAWRYTYALEDMSGNIVEIYPPTNTVPNLGNFIGGTCWNHVTVPEGRYRVVCLYNIPNNRNVWYRIPFVDTFDERDQTHGKDYGWKWGAPIPPEKSWRKEQDIIEVKDRRTHNITTPVFSKARDSKGDQDYLLLKEIDIETTIVNVTNQLMRGKVVTVNEYRPWIHPDGAEYLDMWRRGGEKHWSQLGGWADQVTPWKKEVAEAVPVVLEPNGEATVILKVRDMLNGVERGSYEITRVPHIVIYWEDEEGNRDLIRGCRTDILNLMERNDWGTIGAHFWMVESGVARLNPNIEGSDDQFFYDILRKEKGRLRFPGNILL